MSEGATLPTSDGRPQETLATNTAGVSSESGPAGPTAGSRKEPTERRKRRRALISAPVRVRALYTSSNGPDEVSSTVDVSRNGFLFVSPRANFSNGMTVAVTFPYSNSPVAMQSEQPGRVVRVSKLTDGRFAVAVVTGPAQGNTQAAAAEQNANAPASTSAERPLVIVVDADEEMRDSLKTFLTAQGYEVMALSSARQAHTLLNQVLPSLLIAEIEGDDLPGLDLCARIKSTARLHQVPVVLTTRSAFPSDYSNAHSLGAVVCMAKPFRMERIGHVVRLLVPTGTRVRGEDGSGNPKRGGGKDLGDLGDPTFRLRR
jgi:CheY-like chemotaxis protein